MTLSKTASKSESLSFALIGSPNSGKTTLFNALTGLKQKVGNYTGVTVEKKTGQCFSQHGEPIQIVDLPGIHSLASCTPDAVITQRVLLGHEEGMKQPDALLLVLDASLLARQLYVPLRVLELGIPSIIVLNMMDVANLKGLSINTSMLSKLLGAPVIGIQATDPKSLLALKIAMSRPLAAHPPQKPLITEEMLPHIEALSQYGIQKRHLTPSMAHAEALLSLSQPEGCPFYPKDKDWIEALERHRNELDSNYKDWREVLIKRRYAQIAGICQKVLTRNNPHKKNFTETIDAITLHPIFGMIGLILVLGFLFFLIFYLAEIPKGWIEDALESFSQWVDSLIPEGEFKDLLIDGVIAGVGGVLAFLPQILLLFLGIGLLESSGYLARAAFLLDRPMQRVGLQGRSFIPFLSSYACAIPGIMATRTIDCKADRLTTIMISPWASCSARLPVYIVMLGLIDTSIKHSAALKALCLLGLYALGTLSAFIMAWMLRSTLLKGESRASIIELPLYRRPQLSSVLWEMWLRAQLFIVRAGTVILPLSILLWYLMSHPVRPDASASETLIHSYAGQIGHFIEPILKPLGFDWKIAIGLIAAFAAREVFVSTMAIIYGVSVNNDEALSAALHEASTGSFTPLTCISLLIFFVYAMQCISTLAIVKRETHSWGWPLFQLAFMTAIAYFASLLVYQGGLLLGFH